MTISNGYYIEECPNLRRQPRLINLALLGLMDLGTFTPCAPRPASRWLGVHLKLHCDIFLCVYIVNCWPSENDGQCDVNIEYELQQEELELKDVTITIPVP